MADDAEFDGSSGVAFICGDAAEGWMLVNFGGADDEDDKAGVLIRVELIWWCCLWGGGGEYYTLWCHHIRYFFYLFHLNDSISHKIWN